jgi:hypothetical protein
VLFNERFQRSVAKMLQSLPHFTARPIIFSATHNLALQPAFLHPAAEPRAPVMARESMASDSAISARCGRGRVFGNHANACRPCGARVSIFPSHFRNS